jgi:RNA polymerase sigma-70 factor (ECF subfamily)
MLARAYRVLGSPDDAEDAVQEALLRVHEAERAGTEIRDPAPFALTVAARVAIDRRRCARANREYTVGGAIPFVADSSLEPGPAERAVIAEDLARALLMLMRSLTPLERAVWLLREAFGYPYAEIALLVGKTELNCRQVGRRARTRLEHPDADVTQRSSRLDGDRLARDFIAACECADAAAAVRLVGGGAALHG